MTTTDKKMKQRKISKQKKKDRKESFRFLRQWVSEKECFFFLFQLQKTFLLHLPVKDGEDESDQCQRHQSIHVKQEEKKGTLKLFFGKKKKQARPKKNHLFFFAMYYCFFNGEKKHQTNR